MKKYNIYTYSSVINGSLGVKDGNTRWKAEEWIHSIKLLLIKNITRVKVCHILWLSIHFFYRQLLYVCTGDPHDAHRDTILAQCLHAHWYSKIKL